MEVHPIPRKPQIQQAEDLQSLERQQLKKEAWKLTATSLPQRQDFFFFFFKLAAILKEASGRSYPVTQRSYLLLSCFTIAEKIIYPPQKKKKN